VRRLYKSFGVERLINEKKLTEKLKFANQEFITLNDMLLPMIRTQCSKSRTFLFSDIFCLCL
jgi:hypothetical protein